MNPLFVAPILELVQSFVGRIFPDKEKAAEAEREFMRLAMDGELKQVLAQLEINAKEAAHPSVWVSGWRPGFGWVGCLGFLYEVLARPMLTWYCSTKGLPSPPELSNDLLWVVTTGLLGIGGLRTFEKSKGVSK